MIFNLEFYYQLYYQSGIWNDKGKAGEGEGQGRGRKKVKRLYMLKKNCVHQEVYGSQKLGIN